MNKERFIEQLNLYLDEELSEQDSDKLLAAVRRNPEYHRIYRQYCQIHQACSQLGDAFSNEEKPAPAWRQKVYAYGGMAAAVGLLALAAQNLSPFVSSSSSPNALIVGVPQSSSVNETQSESLLVVGSSELDGGHYRLENSMDLVSFDLDTIFVEETSSTSFTPPVGVKFARFEVSSEAKDQHEWQRDFAFGEPIQASTFEHEAVSSQLREENPFELQSVDGRENGIVNENRVRFDLDRAAATLRERKGP